MRASRATALDLSTTFTAAFLMGLFSQGYMIVQSKQANERGLATDVGGLRQGDGE